MVKTCRNVLSLRLWTSNCQSSIKVISHLEVISQFIFNYSQHDVLVNMPHQDGIFFFDFTITGSFLTLPPVERTSDRAVEIAPSIQSSTAFTC